MKPIYGENIVVAIKNNKLFDWYVLEKDYCFLDYTKLEEAYKNKGYDVVIDDEQRFGIKVVNELTKNIFLDGINQNKISVEELSKMLQNEQDSNNKLAYNPSIMIDFDKKMLISYYAEPESFENFIPHGWQGEYRDFTNEIPAIQRYWTNKNVKKI